MQRVKITKWSGSPVGVTLDTRWYSLTKDNISFVDSIGDVRPLTLVNEGVIERTVVQGGRLRLVYAQFYGDMSAIKFEEKIDGRQ